MKIRDQLSTLIYEETQAIVKDLHEEMEDDRPAQKFPTIDEHPRIRELLNRMSDKIMSQFSVFPRS